MISFLLYTSQSVAHAFDGDERTFGSRLQVIYRPGTSLRGEPIEIYHDRAAVQVPHRTRNYTTDLGTDCSTVGEPACHANVVEYDLTGLLGTYTIVHRISTGTGAPVVPAAQITTFNGEPALVRTYTAPWLDQRCPPLSP